MDPKDLDIQVSREQYIQLTESTHNELAAHFL